MTEPRNDYGFPVQQQPAKPAAKQCNDKCPECLAKEQSEAVVKMINNWSTK